MAAVSSSSSWVRTLWLLCLIISQCLRAPHVSQVASHKLFLWIKWKKKGQSLSAPWVMKPHFFSLARNGVREGAEKETNHLNEQGLGFCNFQKCFLADKDPQLLLLIYKSGKLFLRLISLPFAHLKGHYIQMDCPGQCGWRCPRQITSHLIKFEFLF